MSEDVYAKTLVITLSTPFLRFDQQRADLLLMSLVMNELGLRLKSPLSAILPRLADMVKLVWSGPWRSKFVLAGMAAGYLATAAIVYRYFIQPIHQAPGTIAAFLCRLVFDAQACVQAPFWYFAHTALPRRVRQPVMAVGF